MRIAIILTLFIFLANAYSNAAEFELGVKKSSVDIANENVKSEVSFQGGVTSVIPIAKNIGIKTGMLYSERNFAITVNKEDQKTSISYLDVPLLLAVNLSDEFLLMVGTSLCLNIGSSASTAIKPKSEIIPFTVGSQIYFAPDIYLFISYESVDSIAIGVDSYRAASVNLGFTFN